MQFGGHIRLGFSCLNVEKNICTCATSVRLAFLRTMGIIALKPFLAIKIHNFTDVVPSVKSTGVMRYTI